MLLCIVMKRILIGEFLDQSGHGQEDDVGQQEVVQKGVVWSHHLHLGLQQVFQHLLR